MSIPSVVRALPRLSLLVAVIGLCWGCTGGPTHDGVSRAFAPGSDMTAASTAARTVLEETGFRVRDAGGRIVTTEWRYPEGLAADLDPAGMLTDPARWGEAVNSVRRRAEVSLHPQPEGIELRVRVHRERLVRRDASDGFDQSMGADYGVRPDATETQSGTDVRWVPFGDDERMARVLAERMEARLR